MGQYSLVPGILGSIGTRANRLRRLFGARDGSPTPPTFGGGLTASELGYGVRNPNRTGYGDFSNQDVFPVSVFQSPLRRAFDARAVAGLPLAHPALPIAVTPAVPGSAASTTAVRRAFDRESAPTGYAASGIPGLYRDPFGALTHSSDAAENKQYGYWGRSAYENPFGNGFLIGGGISGRVLNPEVDMFRSL